MNDAHLNKILIEPNNYPIFLSITAKTPANTTFDQLKPILVDAVICY